MAPAASNGNVMLKVSVRVGGLRGGRGGGEFRAGGGETCRGGSGSKRNNMCKKCLI